MTTGITHNVMAGLDPAIHDFTQQNLDVDARDQREHDDRDQSRPSGRRSSNGYARA